MTISHVSTNCYEADTASMPSHQAGDLIIVTAYRRSTTVVPTVPTRFEHGMFATRSAANRANIASFIIAASASEVVGTWTNAEFLVIQIYRDSVNYLTVGARTDTTNSGSTTAIYPSLTSTTASQSPLQRSETQSWVAAVVLLNLNSTDGDAPPAGMTNRASLAGATDGEVAGHDTNGTADWNSSVNVTISASTAWATIVYEIWDTGIAKNSDTPTARGGGYKNMAGGMQ